MKFCLALPLLGSLDATLQIVCGALLACLALVLPFVWLGEKGVRPFHALLVLLRALPLAGRILLCGLFCAGGYVFGSKFLPPPASAPVATCLSEGGGMSAVSDPPVGAAPRLRTLELWSPPLPPPVPQTFPRPALTGIVPTQTSVLLRAEWPGESAYTGRYVEFLAKPDLSTSDWVRVGGARAGSWERGVAVELPRALLPFDASRAAFFSFDGGVDADGDGMPDGWELAHGLSPEEPSDATADLDGDGFPNLVEFLMDADPSDAEGVAHGFAFQAPGIPASLSAWTVSPADFRFAFPGGTGRVIAERTFRVDRTTPAQQLFVSSAPGTGSWMDRGGWDGWDVEMSYSIDGGPFIGAPSVSAAAWRLPLGPDPVGTVTVRLSAASDEPCLSTPLYLVRWTPRYVFAEGEGVQILRGTNGAEVVSARRDAASADFRIHARVDLSSLPGGCVAPEAGLFVSPAPGLRVEVVDAAGGEVVLRADGPLWAELPPQGADAPVAICCWEVSCETSGDIDAGPRSSPTASPWPLSTAARRRAFHRARNLPSSGIASFSVLPDHPRVAVAVGAGRALRSAAPGGSCTCADDCASCTWAVLDGSVTLGRACFCHDGDGPPDEGPDPPVEVGGEDEPPQECGCGDGADNAPAEQLELGSLRLRVPLGSSASDGLYGYVWASLEEPAEISPDLFRVLGAAGVSASTNAFGEFTATCSRPGGRTVAVSRIADGVAISVTNNASGRLEYRWEVANADDPDMYGAVRVRRLTVSGNPTSDETYCLDGGPPFEQPLPAGARVGREEPSRRTARWDALRGTWTSRASWRQDPSGPDFVTDEAEAVSLGGTQRVSCVVSEYAKLGSGAFTRRRLTRRFGYDASGPLDESRTYWTDGAHPLRHGRLRSLRSNREPWRLHEYDALGRESVRLEQLDGSPFPESLAADGVAVSHLAELPEGCSARAVVTSYAPGPGDAAHRNDRDLPRRREAYVLRAGAAPLLVRTETWTYARAADAAGVPVRTCTHTSVHGADASLPPAVDSRTEYPEGDYAVPANLRGRVLSETDADGVTTTTAWERGDWNAGTRAFAPAAGGAFLRATSLRSRGEATDKTYAVEVSELSRRLVVHSETCLAADDAVLEWTSSAYDDVGRLRSRLYSDGTSETNAYSCCRLLWSQDRRGRKVLRSARTGTDDLYHAEEEVWLGDVSTNGTYRVTQHFADGLGRETATVTYAGSVPGEAQDPVEPDASQTPSRTSTAYAVDGNAEVIVRTDERGAATTATTIRYDDQEIVHTVVLTNGVTVSEEEVYAYRNGATFSIRRIPAVPDGAGGELAPAQYLEERRWAEWGADGLRADYAAEWTAAYGFVTNSVTRYDHLDRVATEWTPLGTTEYAYDGTSQRRVFSTRTAGDVVRATTYLHDGLGEQVGSVEDGITNRTDVSYEVRDGAYWRVSTQVVAGPGTNSVAVVRERQTGLSDGLRSRTETVGPDGVWTAESSSFDPATGEETLVSESSVRTSVTTRRRCGVDLGTVFAEEAMATDHDAFGRAVRTWRREGDGPLRIATVSEFSSAGDLVRLSTFTNETDAVSEKYACDAFGRRVLRTDALGHATGSVYDGWRRQVLVAGAAYPVRQVYDALGNRVALGTTRNGTDWDWTRWTYDPATRLCTSKTYADGSIVTYTHTPDGLPLRTTYASGKWKECVYDARRRLVGMRHSGGAPDPGAQDSPAMEDYGLVHDAYGMPISVTDAAGCVARLAHADDSVLTNEVWTAAGRTNVFAHSVDAFRRSAGYAFSVDGVAKGGVGYAYDAEGRICSVSATNAAGRSFSVAYANCAGFNYGYTVLLPGGGTLRRVVERDPHRCGLVTACRTSCNVSEVDAYVDAYVYAFDADGRPVSRNGDAFGYDARGQVTYAAIGTNVFTHAYDSIGNHVLGGVNAVTNTYVPNCLNQRVSIISATAPSRVLSYNVDGGLADDGRFAYTYDAEDRLVSVTSRELTNGAVRVRNAYDWRSRRVAKCVDRYDAEAEVWRPAERRDFVWDGWNIVHETVSTFAGETVDVTEVQYFWGPDLSGTLDGAGGVGGLLAVSRDGHFYFPVYDNNGNVMKYVDESGDVVAAYAYDAFGSVISLAGDQAASFVFGFSTKYLDRETAMIAYPRRFYDPNFGIWISRDPIEEDGGQNLYCYCLNDSISRIDADGKASVSSIISGNLGYDKSWPLLGPFGIPIGATGARLQIHAFISGELFQCCQDGVRKLYARANLGLEPYIVWGKGKSRNTKGRDRNKPDTHRPGKQKDYSTDPQDSGYRSRSWHVGGAMITEPCPKSGIQFEYLSGSIFLRGSAGAGVGAQFNIQKNVDGSTDVTSGWSVSGEFATGVWGATIEFGGNVHATATYGPL